MEKLSMCRLCLAKNVPMNGVVNKNLHELYEKLTDTPFVTEDKRPILACFICCAKLKQCFRFKTKCLEAEKLFAQMMNEPNPSINPDHLEFCSGFTRSPVEQINIVEKCEPESIVSKVKVEPADCEGLDKENQTEEYLEDVKDIPLEHSETDSEGDTLLKVFKIEVEEQIEEPKNKPEVVDTNSARFTRKIKLEDTTTVELMKNEPSSLEVFTTTGNRTSKPGTSYKDPYNYAQLIYKKTHECDVCQHSFNRKDLLGKHMRVHTGEKPYKCQVCQRSFSESGSLKKHIRIHTGEKPYECNVCRRSFIESGGLKNHMRTHTGEKPFMCDVCQRSFSQAGALRKHTRIHTGEKPHICDVCQRGFIDRPSLTKHFRTHTGEKPYSCDVCQRSFSQMCELTRHLRTHTGEKPYKCNVCQKSFGLKGNLTKHIRIHAAEKLYKCSVCPRSFNQKYSFNNHILNHTGAKS